MGEGFYPFPRTKEEGEKNAKKNKEDADKLYAKRVAGWNAERRAAEAGAGGKQAETGDTPEKTQ
ncbi:hypothetical protein COY33_02010 [candidate division WWE3 bacterium CG_4_10_14_0_2_um_filter_42_7]|uniref:Uncharacterized protein n=1 Tax=candidate division WWE3 bacterium CG_4_10_14_0_2_um_filter_42_7 TaxID=1975073 RepID=A0A2M7TCU0_UNCKA|nr:MAG: hypothetical protein COY33_02010 [candidate division WWE3 bacterium CG_4_10_14_0_2_um_filter_42_7]